MSSAGKTGHAVDSMHIWALRDAGMRDVAGAIDGAKDTSSNGQLSYPEIQWARAELDKLKAGEASALSKTVKPENIDAFAEGFDKLERAFHSGAGLLQLTQRPALRIGGKTYKHVFELPKDADLNAMMEVTQGSGFDKIVVEDDAGNRFLALNSGGHLKRVRKHAEAVLATEKFDQVKVIHVEDINNAFWEGALLIPRKLGQLVGNVFGASVDDNLNKQVKSGVTGSLDATANGTSNSNKASSGLVAAGVIGMGTIGASAFIAAMPQVAIGVGAVAVVGSLFNAVSGAAKKQDPFFILNVAGVQLASSDRQDLDKMS